ncbi:MAG: alpha/beta hydrolase [Bacteroides sp.]|nr:alpha/beta hydrolase [Eubacterium sp.]MCM1419354.1 alpha/beta hydrolase [Roseburia sp.]MCM1463192.1 alpha/beta hydrolase [Bacteroides sp.]
MKKIIAAAGIVCGLISALCALLYKIYLYTDLRKFPPGNPDRAQKWLRKAQSGDCYITARDGLYLHGTIVKNGGDRWVILMHGYDSEGKDMAEYAEQFHKRGYNVLLPDQRGFGLSEGRKTTMGEKEQYDVVGWINFLNRRERPAQILLFGVSLGASTVLLASGRTLPKNVAAVIEDCGYTSVYAEFKYNLRQLFRLPAFPFLTVIDLITRLKDGWSLRNDADCIRAVRRSTLPTLFIHGSADTFVPFYMQDELFEAAACPKEKLVVYGAGHAQCVSADPELYWETVDRFLHSLETRK